MISKDPAMFEADKLSQFDAIVFNNATGDWLQPDEEAMKAMSAEQKAQAEAAVERRGGRTFSISSPGARGLVGIHAATDGPIQMACVRGR